MLQTIENVNAAVNNFVWGVPAMVCIIGVGLVLSARTGFIQFRKFGYAIKNSIGRIFTKSEAKEGSITPFQAVCTALAATVGTGNIAGVAGAIAIGGAGAVFWMWVSALLGMCTKFSEVTLAVHYREKNAEGDYVGGPMYYIKNGLGKKWYWMASVYAILGSLTVLGTGNATQVNTITTSIDSALISYNVIDDAQISMVNLVIGIVIAALVAVVLLGGVKRIGTVTEKLVPFQAVCTALAATVGTGNIAGVAGAIAIGGAGAVFWMWVSALLGMCTKFSEVTLAVHYREKNAEGDYVGGPMYYIKNGLGKKWYWMASVYAILGSLTVLGTGNATQVNTITTSIDSALISYNVIDDAQISMVNLVIGIVIAALVAVVLLGGVKRIGTVTEKLVPFMAVFYIILAIGVVALNADKVPHVFEMIFVGAFNPSAFTGGVVGSMFMTMRRGVSRGIFSNEAGIGTGSIAHACADTDEPVKQGMFGIFEVFADTIVICTLTALVILCGGEGIQYGVAAGAELTISGFVTTYGSWVTIFTAIAMCCFAFSTILGWGLYGARCVEFVFTTKVVKPFMIVYALVAILGATVDLGIIWGIADTCNGLMSIPNLIALFLLSGTVAKLVKDYFAKQEKKN